MKNPLAKYNEPARRLADRLWAVKTYGWKHHWTRLDQCRNALVKFDGDIDKAFWHIVEKSPNKKRADATALNQVY